MRKIRLRRALLRLATMRSRNSSVPAMTICSNLCSVVSKLSSARTTRQPSGVIRSKERLDDTNR